MKDLSKLYLKYPALYKEDYNDDGFKWIDCHQEERCIYAFQRKAGSQRIIAVFNFSDKDQDDYELTVGEGKKIKIIIDSNMKKYGGTRKSDVCKYEALIDGKLSIDLPPFTSRYYLVN